MSLSPYLRASMVLLSFVSLIHAAPPTIERTLIVSGPGQGYFPVAHRLADNRTAVVLRGGAPHLGIKGRLDIVFSSDEGKTWTKPTVVVDGPADDRNPAFGQAADGTLVVAYWVTERYDENGRYNEKLDKPVHTHLTRSSDGGKTWSSPVDINVSDIGYGSPYGRILTLPDNSMLMNIYGGPVQEPAENRHSPDNSYLYRSIDHGQSWTRHSHPGKDNFNETSFLQLKSGPFLAAMRSTKGEVWLTQSDDLKTWTPPTRLTPAGVHPADLAHLPDGRLLLVTGHRLQPFGVRALVASPTADFDWTTNFPLVTDTINTDCGYPTAVLLKSGHPLVIYYATGSKDNPTWKEHAAAVSFNPPK